MADSTSSFRQPESHAFDEIHLQDYLKVLLGRWRLVVIIFLLVAGSVILHTFLQAPVYEAEATLYLREEKGRDTLLSELTGASGNSIPAELEILRSRTLAEQVVRDLHLNLQAVGDAEVRVSEIRNEGAVPLSLEILPRGGYRLFSGDTSLGEGVAGTLFVSGEIELLVDQIDGDAGTRVLLKEFDPVLAADFLRSRIRAQEVGSRTGIIRVSITDTDPVRARRVIESLSQAYLDQAVSYKTEEARNTLEFIDQQLGTVRDALNRAEKSVEEYQTENGVAGLSLGAESIVSNLVETEKTLADLDLRGSQVDFAVESLQGSGRGLSTIPVDEPAVDMLLQQILELEKERARIGSEYVESALPLESIDRDVVTLKGNLRDVLEGIQKKISIQKRDHRKLLNRYEDELRKLPTSERELARLRRLSEVNAGIYTFLLEKREEARIARAATTSNVSIIDPAVTPRIPVKPNKKRNVVLGLVLGALAGIGVAFFLDYFQDAVKDGEMASRLLRWPVLGVIPFIPAGKKNTRKVADSSAVRARTLITSQAPKSPPAEAFRSLRTALHFVQGGASRKVLLVTSSLPGEGKTTIAANLAEILVQAGKRVLLIGCDMRRPTLHTVFDSPLSPGLSEYLSEQINFEAIHIDSGLSGLHFINSGVTPPNPAELLASSRMGELIERVRGDYDTIMIDAPPILAVADAAVLSAYCDSALIVVEAAGVSKKVVLKMRDIVDQIGIHVAGIAMNDKRGKGWAYYSGYYGDGGYVYPEQKGGVVGRIYKFFSKIGRKY